MKEAYWLVGRRRRELERQRHASHSSGCPCYETSRCRGSTPPGALEPRRAIPPTDRPPRLLRPRASCTTVLVPVAVDSPRRYTGAMNAIDERACGKPGCDNFGKPGLSIVGHGWFVTTSGRRRRYRCTVCGGPLSTNTGTAYRGLRCSRREFDQVASLRVEGVCISATARVTGHSRTTIARWLERAATAAACFNHRLLRDFDVIELQADARCTFIGSKRRTLWLFATIEVCSRLWAGSVLGRRSHRNTKAAINDVILRGRRVGCPLIATDGFEYYVGVMVAPLGFSVRLWASAQDAAEQSCRSGRAAREDRHGEPAERRAVGVGGCRDPEHVVHRAPQPHDSSRVGVLAPALAMPRSWRRPAPRARRAPAVLLQFHSAAPGVEVRARDQDAGDAGRSGEPALGVARHLHGGRSHATYGASVIKCW